MFKKRIWIGIILSIILLVFSISGFTAYYKYTQESGTNFYVGTADKADALEDTNEMRQIIDDLGALLGHSKRDDLYPKNGTTGGTIYIEKSKFNATSAPTVNNDIDEGYKPGSLWVDVTNDKGYVCLDNTDGAAVWTETTGAGGASTFITLTDTPANYTGQAGKYTKVNAGETALEFGTPAGGVDTSGTPVQYDYARFTDVDTIEGRSYAEVISDLTDDKIHFSSDYATLQAALNALSVGDTLIIDKTHNINTESSAGVTLSTSNVTIVWLNIGKIDGSDLAATSTIFAIAGTGKTVTTDNLTTNATEGATSVSIGSGNEADYSVGDWVMIESTAVYVTGNNILEGEIARVLSTADGVLNLNHPLFDGYTTANTAKVTKLSMVENIRLINPSILGGGSASEHLGLTLTWATNAYIENPFIIDAESRAIQLKNVVGYEVSGGRLVGSNLSGYGYGVVIANACQYGKIHNVVIDDCRNAIDWGGDTEAGVARYSIAKNNTCISSSLNGINCHPSVGYIEILNNKIIGAGQDGIATMNSQNRIEGNVIIYPAQAGINTYNQDAGHNTRIIIKDNIIEYPTQDGIEYTIWETHPGQDFIKIEGNIIKEATAYAIDIRGDTTQDITNVDIVNNKIQGVAGAYAIYLDYAQDCTINGNRVEPESDIYGIRFQRATNVSINNNIIIGTGESTKAGIYTVSMDGVFTVNCNTISGFDIGIQTDDKLGLVTGNLVHGNTDGLSLGASTVSGGDNLNQAGVLE